MAHLLLVRPPIVFSRTAYSAAVTMPLASAYLAANLEKHGHDVSVIDALGEDIDHIATSYSDSVCYRGLSEEAILDRITETPDGIGVTTMFSQDWPHIEGMIGALRCKFPETPVILGGEHATAATEYVLSSCPPVDFVGRGEGEDIIVDFADYLDGKKRVEDIPGISFRGSSGVIANDPRPRVRAVDELPWPAWDRFDLEPYFRTGEGHGVERGRSMPILATRGCPYQCTFCSSPSMWTTRYVMRDVANVVDEIEHYIRRYRADNIDFFDLTAIIKKQWILDFCRELKRRQIELSWQLPSGTRSEAMDGEVLEEMASSGCSNVTYAPESGSERTLKNIKKKVKLPNLYESIRAAKRNGIFVKCNLIVGFPLETRWDMLKSVWIAIRFAWLGVDDTGIYSYSPYPGSELFDYLRKTGAVREMDREYFVSLMSFTDLSQTSNYCENVGPREMTFYRLLGMTLFYGLSFLLHPSRILRVLRNYRQSRSDTVFEERLFGLLRRWRLERRGGAEAKGAA
jgi:radical SAM superfamily enzyme YgiQ (UPF0313 family)